MTVSQWFFRGLVMLCLGLPGLLQAAEPGLPIRTLIDVRTTHSDGAHDMDALVGMAKARGIQALAFVDHGRKGIRFGIDPIPGILGYTKDLRSLYTTGLPAFFADLYRVRRAYPDIALLAGTESIGGYTWTGVPFRDLTLHNSERMLITLGAERPAQIEALPSHTLKNVRGDFPVSVAFWGVLGFVMMMMLLKRRRWSVLLLFFVCCVALITTLIFRPQVNAHADLIAAAHKQGLFVIWAYPGTHSGVRPGPMGVKLDTPPYNERVFTEPTADAFAAVYGDTDSNTIPGGLWDVYMSDYMNGFHAHPIWAVAAGDFHGQGQAGEHLGNFPMDVWTAGNATSPKAMLAAMHQGHMVSWRMPKNRNVRINTLFLEDAIGKHWIPGDEVTLPGQVILHCSLTEQPAAVGPSMAAQLLRVQIIVDGHVAGLSLLGLGQPLRETLQLAPGAHVIRLRIPVQNGIHMEANPFLVRVP